jgi:hypothetical protein
MIERLPSIPPTPEAFFASSNIGSVPMNGPFVNVWFQMAAPAQTLIDDIGLSALP